MSVLNDRQKRRLWLGIARCLAEEATCKRQRLSASEKNECGAMATPVATLSQQQMF